MPATALVRSTILATIGLVLVIIGIGVYFGVASLVKKRLRESLTIDSKDHKDYDRWVDGFDDEEPYNVRKHFVFNLTNPQEFAAGLAKPNFEQFGPFVYRHYTPKSKVVFDDDGNRVNYQAEDIYVFQPDASVRKSDTDLHIININTIYVHLVNSVGGEANLPALVAGGISRQFAANPQGAAAWGTFAPLPCTPVVPGVSFCSLANISGTSGLMTPQQSVAILKTLSDTASVGAFIVTVSTLASPVAPANVKAAALQRFVASGLNSTWGGLQIENPAVLTAFALYFSDIATKTQTLIQATSGPLGPFFEFTTPRDVVFAPDPFLRILGTVASFKTNNTVTDFRCRTGKDDEKYAGMNYFEKYESIETVTIYKEDYPSEGRTKSFSPFLDDVPEVANVYYATMRRHLKAHHNGEETIQGVPAERYQFNTKEITGAYPEFFTAIPGMVWMGPVKLGLPVYLSVPHMHHVADEYVNRISGMDRTVEYPSFAWIEKTTGAAIQGRRQLQVNTFLNFTMTSFTGITPMDKEFFVPIFFDIEYGEIHPEVAKRLKKAVVDSVVLRKAVMGVLGGVGGLLVLISALVFVSAPKGAAEDGESKNANEPTTTTKVVNDDELPSSPEEEMPEKKASDSEPISAA